MSYLFIEGGLLCERMCECCDGETYAREAIVGVNYNKMSWVIIIIIIIIFFTFQSCISGHK